MEGQSPLTPQTITHEQSLVTVSMTEQSPHTRPPQAEQQSLLEDTCITADRADSQAEEGTQGEFNSTESHEARPFFPADRKKERSGP